MKKIRGKKGKGNLPKFEVPTPKINVNVQVPQQREKDSRDSEESKPIIVNVKTGDKDKTNWGGIIAVLVIISLVIGVLFYTAFGQFLLDQAGVTFQSPIAFIKDIFARGGEILKDPTGGIGEWKNPDAVPVGDQDLGITITSFKTTEQTYALERPVKLSTSILLKELEAQRNSQITIRCSFKPLAQNAKEKIKRKPIPGAVTLPALGFKEPAPEIIIDSLHFQQILEAQPTPDFIEELTLVAYCHTPEQFTEGYTFPKDTSYVTTTATIEVIYGVQSYARLPVYMRAKPLTKEELPLFIEDVSGTGVQYKDNRIVGQTQGGALNTKLSLDVDQPITSATLLSEDASIIVTYDIKNTKGWKGHMTKLHDVRITQLPQYMQLDQEQCQDFSGQNLKTEIIDRINECEALRATGEEQQCDYDLNNLHFYCAVRVIELPPNIRPLAYDLIGVTNYEYAITQDGVVTYRNTKPSDASSS